MKCADFDQEAADYVDGILSLRDVQLPDMTAEEALKVRRRVLSYIQQLKRAARPHQPKLPVTKKPVNRSKAKAARAQRRKQGR